MRALEEQGDAIKGAAEGMMAAVISVETVLRSVDNMKGMIEMTRRAMVFAHGDRVVERVEVKRKRSLLKWRTGTVVVLIHMSLEVVKIGTRN